MIDNNTLYASFRDGDSEAFDALVERHHARLVIRMTRHGVDPTIAEEIAYRVFARLAELAHKFDRETNDVTGWMNWLANNLSREHERIEFAEPRIRIEHEVSERMDIYRRTMDAECKRLWAEFAAEVKLALSQSSC